MSHDHLHFAEVVAADRVAMRGLPAYRAALADMVAALAAQDWEAERSAAWRLRDVVADAMQVGELVGALRTLQHAGRALVAEGIVMSADRAMIVFRETAVEVAVAAQSFGEHVQDMLSRVPFTLRAAAERTAAAIARAYSEGRAIGFVRSAEEAVTERVHKLLAEFMAEGTPEPQAIDRIRRGVDEVRQRTEAWTDAYARTAFRNNVNTAVTAGKFRQAMDPAIRAVMPAAQYETQGDGDVRPNHAAADGIVLRMDNPAWAWLAPPMGHNCRCQVRMLSLGELRRMGRIGADGQVVESHIPSGAHPDPGFRPAPRSDLLGVS